MARSRKHPHSLVFHDVSWDFYLAILKEFNEKPSRVNYSHGTLEIMALPFEHEHPKALLGSMVALIAVARRLRLINGGSITLKRSSRHRGLDTDRCYWIQNEAAVRSVKRINLKNDPPPDLVIEIDVMHSVVDREAIYAKLGVPEMWVLNRDATMSAYKVADGKWQAIEMSVAIPVIKPAELGRFAQRVGTEDDTSILTAFNEWLQSLKAHTAS